MSSSSERRLGSDESGVSEVLSFLFSFLMAVIILVTSLYAFGQINQAARDLGSHSQLREIADRVSLALQESLQVANARVASAGSADSVQLRYQHVIDVPALLQGLEYTMTLDKNYVNGSVPARGVIVSVATFNAAVSFAPASDPLPLDTCASTYVACQVTGSNVGNKGQIVMTYLFEPSGDAARPRSLIQIE